MGKLRLIRDKVYKFLKDAWENYCSIENYPCYIYLHYTFSTLYHPFEFYEIVNRIKENKNIRSKNF